MSQACQIRPATEHDFNFILDRTCRLQQHEQQRGQAMLETSSDIQTHIKNWLTQFISLPHVNVLIADIDNVASGFCLGYLQSNPNPFSIYTLHGIIQLLWVDEPQRQHGIGEKLAQAMQDDLKHAGAQYLELQFIAGFEPAARFWKKQGFKVCGHIARKLDEP